MDGFRPTSLNFDFSVKVILLGDHNVGRMAIVRKYKRQNLTNGSPAQYRARRRHSLPVLSVAREETIDLEIKRNEKKILMKMMDTGGQEKYRSLTASYYRGAHGCLVLFDVTKLTTFDNVTNWLHDLKEYSSQPEISTILVGTKCHVREEEREVNTARAQMYAESVGLPYMEVSAEEGININEVFEKLADLIIGTLQNNKIAVPKDTIRTTHLVSESIKKRRQWCSC